jgi:hypothetical protein
MSNGIAGFCSITCLTHHYHDEVSLCDKSLNIFKPGIVGGFIDYINRDKTVERRCRIIEYIEPNRIRVKNPLLNGPWITCIIHYKKFDNDPIVGG